MRQYLDDSVGAPLAAPLLGGFENEASEIGNAEFQRAKRSSTRPYNGRAVESPFTGSY